MKIACCGTQNIGKSTFIDDFLLKWPMYKKPEKSYRDVLNLEKINENGDEENQKIILDLLCDQAFSYSKEDNVIFDRCVLDNLVYTTWLAVSTNRVSEEFLLKSRTIVMEALKTYDILFFFPISRTSIVPVVSDGVRSVDEKYRNDIDILFKLFQESYYASDGKIFPKHNCPALIEIYGNREERIQLASLYIRPDGNPYKEEESLIKI